MSLTIDLKTLDRTSSEIQKASASEIYGNVFSAGKM